ncbi:uncharacterized protein LOC131650456 [Vicia villosa]|uniref:uncharacterized protein LOC131650456 n=1 Tax=Vicia villosa TaxID=3911 RepID=UPI00273C6F63|nr:uncharacterized protein LOC131650456 [Vicia villosa]
MQKEEEKEESAMDSLSCLSFSIYSSNNSNDVAKRVINENDHSRFQNDNDNFEFFAFQKTADEAFFDHRRGNTTQGVFSIFKRDDAAEISNNLKEEENDESETEALSCPSFSVYSSNSLNDVAERVIYENNHSYSQNDNDDFEFVAFQKTAYEVFPIFNRGDQKRNSDAAENLTPLQNLIIGDEKQNIESRQASPIKCIKSNSTGSDSNPSCYKPWKFLSLLRRSKSDVKESFILATPVENSKVKSGGKVSAEKNIARVPEKKIPMTERKVPAAVTAMEAVYLRKKEIKRKSYLPYKQELISFPLHV